MSYEDDKASWAMQREQDRSDDRFLDGEDPRIQEDRDREDDLRTEMKASILAKLKAGGRLNIHSCDFCGYRCAFLYVGEQLAYDAGCDCSGRVVIEPREESAIDFYLEPKHGHVEKIEAWLAGL